MPDQRPKTLQELVADANSIAYPEGPPRTIEEMLNLKAKQLAEMHGVELGPTPKPSQAGEAVAGAMGNPLQTLKGVGEGLLDVGVGVRNLFVSPLTGEQVRVEKGQGPLKEGQHRLNENFISEDISIPRRFIGALAAGSLLTGPIGAAAGMFTSAWMETYAKMAEQQGVEDVLDPSKIPAVSKEVVAKNFKPTPPLLESLKETLKSVVGADKWKDLLTGRGPDGEVLSPEEWGKTLLEAAAPTLTSAMMGRAAISRFTRDVIPPGKYAPGLQGKLKLSEAADHISNAVGELIKENPEIKQWMLEPGRKGLHPKLEAKISSIEKDLGVSISEGQIAVGLAREGLPIEDYFKGIHILGDKQVADAHRTVVGYLSNLAPDEATRALQRSALDIISNYEAGSNVGPMRRLASLIRTGAMEEGDVLKILGKQVTSLGAAPYDVLDAYDILGRAIEHHGGEVGRGLQAYSRMERSWFADAYHTNPELQRMLRSWQELDTNQWTSAWSKANYTLGRYIDFARAMGVSQVKTAARNIYVQGGNVGLGIFNDALVDVGAELAYGVGKTLGRVGEDASLRYRHFARLRTDFGLGLAALSSKGRTLAHYGNIMAERIGAEPPFTRTALETIAGKTFGGKYFQSLELYDAFESAVKAMVPADQALLMGAPIAGDVFSQSIGKTAYWKEYFDKMKGTLPGAKPGKLELSAGMISDVMTSALRWQEIEFRRFFFLREAMNGMKKFGYDATPGSALPNWKDFIRDAVTQGEMKKSFVWTKGSPMTPESLRARIGELKQGLGSAVEEAAPLDVSRAGQAPPSVGMASLTKLQRQLSKSMDGVLEALDAGEAPSSALGKLHPKWQGLFGGEVGNPATALGDAVVASLKNTFAFGGLPNSPQAKLLKVYRDFPILHPLTTYYPRFFMNMWEWIIDRDPGQLMGILSPKWWEKFSSLTHDPARGDYSFIEHVGKGAEGAMILAGAHSLQNSPLQGPKYYELYTGQNEKGEAEYLDLRPFQPLSTMSFLLWVVKHAITGEDPKLTASEYSDGFLGVRRLSDTGMWAIVDLFREAENRDWHDIAKIIATPAGQLASLPFTPMRTIWDAMAASGLVEGPMDLPDTRGNEGPGPVMALLSPWDMPSRIDPTTGKPYRGENPLRTQITGLATRSYSEFRENLHQMGMSDGDLVGGPYQRPEADQLVRLVLGGILSSPRGKEGETYSDWISKLVDAKQPGGEEFKKYVMRIALRPVTAAARQYATAAAPSLFAREESQKIDLPESIQKDIEEILKHARPKLRQLITGEQR